MKTRNIFAALAFGLVAAVTLTTVGCTDNTTQGKDIPGKEIHDTIKTTDTISKFNISKITAEAAGDRMEVEFTPDAEWTFTSSTPWLTVISERGTKTDRVLVFDVAENTTTEARVANTILTVGGVKYPLTINQKSGLRMIKVFGAVTRFSDNNTNMRITGIFSNLELEIASIPIWIESAVVDKDENDMYFVDATLKPAQYDDDVRSGEIVLKDKNSDLTAPIAVVCDPASAGFVLDLYDNFETPYPGISVTEGDMTRRVTISQPSGNEDPIILVAYGALNPGGPGGGGVTENIASNVTIEKANTVAPTAAYAVEDWNITLDPYVGNVQQTMAVFAIKTSEKATFKTKGKTPNFLITQTGGVIFEKPESQGVLEFDFTLDGTNNGEVMFSALDAAGDVTVGVIGGTKNEDDENRDTRFRGSVVLKSKTASVGKPGWSDYVYTVTSTKEQTNSIGLPTNINLPQYQVKVCLSHFNDENDVDTWTFIRYLKFNNYATAKTKIPDDKFVFDTWDKAGIAAKSTITLLYRKQATTAGMKIAYSYKVNNVIDVFITQPGSDEDLDGDGYIELVLRAETVGRVTPGDLASPAVYIYHAPLTDITKASGGTIGFTFQEVPVS